MTAPFPELYARTQGFRLGRPQRLALTGAGRRLLFLRSAASHMQPGADLLTPQLDFLRQAPAIR